MKKTYRKKTNQKNGFTVIEMVVVSGILAILAVLTSTMIVSSLKNYRIKNQSVQTEEKVAAVMREFEQKVRAANRIELVSANEFIYYRFFDSNSTSPTKVRYFMDGNQFKVGLTKPVGSEPNITYPPEVEEIDLVIGDVVNSDSLFKFFNGSNVEVTDYQNIPAMTMIQITIELDKNGDAPPAKISGTTKVSLRNMKRNL